MKNYKNLKLILFLLAGILYFSSCSQKFPQNFKPYSPTLVTSSNVNLKYNSPMKTYPVEEVIKSDTPTYNIEGVHSFSMDTAIAESGSFNENNFSVDQESGVISYDNTSGSISPGTYSVSVLVSNVSGVAVVDSVFKLVVQPVPVSFTVDNPKVNANALQKGVIATVGYKDESPDQSISSVTYALANNVTGYSIDANTGAISKSTAAATDTTVALSVKFTTNLGVRTFDSIVMVHVGAPPSIQYVQQDGSTPLTKVTLSPWTGYTSHAPTLSGMESSGGWSLVLPDTINAANFTIGSDGSVTVLPNSNLPQGNIVVGVKATNGSGVSYEFPNVFTLHVEKKWSANPVFYEDFSNYTTNEPVHDYNPALFSYAEHGTSTEFQVANAKNFYGARVFKGGTYTAAIETDMILSLKIDPSWHDMQVSFSEVFGYSDKVLNTWQRTLGFGYDTTGVAAGNYDPANWHILMPANDQNWPGTSAWKTATSNADIPKIPPQDFGGIDNTQNTIFINWWYNDPAGDTNGAQFFITNIKVEVATAYSAIEQ